MGCPGVFTMILNLVLGALIPIISVSGHGNMVWPPTWQDAGGRIGVSPGMNCAAGYEYFFDGDQAKSGAICLWYTNYTMKEGETTIDESLRTFANIEPRYFLGAGLLVGTHSDVPREVPRCQARTAVLMEEDTAMDPGQRILTSRMLLQLSGRKEIL